MLPAWQHSYISCYVKDYINLPLSATAHHPFSPRLYLSCRTFIDYVTTLWFTRVSSLNVGLANIFSLTPSSFLERMLQCPSEKLAAWCLGSSQNAPLLRHMSSQWCSWSKRRSPLESSLSPSCALVWKKKVAFLNRFGPSFRSLIDAQFNPTLLSLHRGCQSFPVANQVIDLRQNIMEGRKWSALGWSPRCQQSLAGTSSHSHQL